MANETEPRLNSIGEWMSRELRSFRPSRELGVRALHHLSKKIRKDLFSENAHMKQNAIGLWYEALIYEILLEQTKPEAKKSILD